MVRLKFELIEFWYFKKSHFPIVNFQQVLLNNDFQCESAGYVYLVYTYKIEKYAKIQ